MHEYAPCPRARRSAKTSAFASAMAKVYVLNPALLNAASPDSVPFAHIGLIEVAAQPWHTEVNSLHAHTHAHRSTCVVTQVN